MRTTRHWLMTIAVLLCSLTVSAHHFKVDGIYYDITSSAALTVGVTYQGEYPTSYSNEYSGVVVIPETVIYNNKKYSVTSIRSEAFIDCGNITSLTIPKSVTEIGSYAFYGCSGELIANCCIPSVTNDYLGAFYNSKFTKATIGGYFPSIGTYAFYGCDNLKSVVILEGVESIMNNAFTDCSYLSSVVFPESLVSIGGSAFAGCKSLTSIDIPKNVTEIESAAFQVCTNLNLITCKAAIPPTVRGSQTFFGINKSIPVCVPSSSISTYQSADYWSEFTNIQTIVIASGTCGDNLTWKLIDEGKLVIEGTGDMDAPTWHKYKAGITSVTIHDGATSIDSYAFQDCSNLTSISIPESVTLIGEDAFYGCSNLSNINIPESVIKIGGQAFGRTAWYNNQPDGLIYINNVLYEYKGIMPENTNIEVRNGTVSISSFAFESYKNLISITIPKSVTSIDNYAFQYCNSLKELVIEDGIEPLYLGYNYIDEWAGQDEGLFHSCNLATIYIGRNLNYGESPFEEQEKLTSVTIGNNVTEIGGQLFWGCSRLSAITLPKSITSIGYDVFCGCNSLNSITCEAKTPPTISYGSFQDVDKSILVYVPFAAISAYKSSYYWKEFTNILPIEKVCTLTDGENFSQLENETHDYVTYTRTFNNTNWQSLYVPFDIDYNNIKDDFDVAYINDVHQFDDDNDGSIDRTQVEAIKITTGVLDANYPYLIRAKEVGEKVITMEDAVLYATEENSIDCSSVFRNYTFTGSYTTKTAVDLPASEGYYALTGGEWKQLSETAKLGAFRVYLKIDSRVAGEEVAEAISMRVVGEDGDEDDATGIDTSEFKSQNTELIYDLQGRRVERPTKGVYIVNGVKRVF